MVWLYFFPPSSVCISVSIHLSLSIQLYSLLHLLISLLTLISFNCPFFLFSLSRSSSISSFQELYTPVYWPALLSIQLSPIHFILSLSHSNLLQLSFFLFTHPCSSSIFSPFDLFFFLPFFT